MKADYFLYVAYRMQIYFLAFVYACQESNEFTLETNSIILFTIKEIIHVMVHTTNESSYILRIIKKEKCVSSFDDIYIAATCAVDVSGVVHQYVYDGLPTIRIIMYISHFHNQPI